MAFASRSSDVNAHPGVTWVLVFDPERADEPFDSRSFCPGVRSTKNDVSVDQHLVRGQRLIPSDTSLPLTFLGSEEGKRAM